MMITINRLDEQTVTGSVNGRAFSVAFESGKYAQMVELAEKSTNAGSMDELRAILEEFEPLTKESYKEIVESGCPYIHVNKSTNAFYLKWNDVLISSKKLPNAFAERIIKAFEKQLDVMPLIKCWVRFMRNPNYSDNKAALFAKYLNASYTDSSVVEKLQDEHGLSYEVAVARATTPQVAITTEGLIVGYKVSREITEKYLLDDDGNSKKVPRYKAVIDENTGIITYEKPEFAEDYLFEPAVMGQGYEAFYRVGNGINEEGHFISVGCSHYLEDWKQVNCDDHTTCVKGLHIGGLSYIHGYQNSDTVTHNVFVDPADIGAVCDIDRTDGAMRVKRYFVHSTFEKVNKNMYFGSDYAAMADGEYEERIKEAVEATQMKEEELQELLHEGEALKAPASADSVL
jgi:hypothetical protein